MAALQRLSGRAASQPSRVAFAPRPRQQRAGGARHLGKAVGDGGGGGGGGEDEIQVLQLDLAASNFARGLNEGEDSDDLVAQQLGAASPSQLTEVQGKYKDAIKKKLEQRAEELRKEQEARDVLFTAGKSAYERGMYPTSVRYLEQALNESGPFSQLGGEIQLWLALAYQACGREDECLATYRTLEKTHPLPAIRRRASSLLYIMEAPKLQISPEERVQIPVLTDLDANKGNRTPVSRPRPPQKKEVPKTWDEEYWENYRPPIILENRYVWAAASVAATVAAVYSSYLSRGLVR